MSALVVYESMYGNTRAIAEAVAEGLGATQTVRVLGVAEVTPADLAQATLLVAGGPTHIHGMSSPRSRRAAVDGAAKAHATLEPAAAGDGVRDLLARSGPASGTPAAAFDTRMPGWSVFTGRASRGISRMLRRAGFRLIAPPASFIVDRKNALQPGELVRARTWGRELGAKMAPTARTGATTG
jgi:hypothetical protein